MRSRAGPRERLVATALLVPAFLPVSALLFYPVVYDLWLSVTSSAEPGGVQRFIGLHRYRALMHDAVFWQAARNTAVLVLATAFVELAVGLLTALLLWWRFWGRIVVFLSVFVPWAFPATFSAFAWYWLLMPPFPAFYALDLQRLRWWLDGLFGMGAWQVLSIAIMNVWRGSSIIAVFLLAGFNAIPEELLDVGKLEARSAWQYFWRVVAPLSRRFLVLAALVALVITYMEYASMYVETGGRITVPVLGTLAFREAIQNGNAGLGAALTLVPIPFAVGLALACLYLLEGRGTSPLVAESTAEPSRRSVVTESSETRGQPARRPDGASAQAGPGVRAVRSRALRETSPPTVPWSAPSAGLPRATFPEGEVRKGGDTPRRRSRTPSHRRAALRAAGLGAALLVTVFHLFPVYYTAVQAFRSIPEYARGNPFWIYDPSFEDVREVVQNPVIWRWGWNTLIVFGAVLAVSLSASILAGYTLARLPLRGGRWLARLLFFSYFVPAMAVIVPVYQLFLRWNLDDTVLAIVLLYLTLTIPFATWLFYLFFQGLPADVEETALLDGNHVAVFLRVVLPMSGPVLIAAGLFSIGMMASDVLYGSTFSLSDGTKTLPAGLGLTAVQLDEWAFANAAILLSSLPIILVCAALSRYYVHGLRAALVEGY